MNLSSLPKHITEYRYLTKVIKPYIITKILEKEVKFTFLGEESIS